MKRILLLFALATLSYSGWSQCSATFVDSAYNSSTFEFTSTYNNLGTTWYSWQFGGATSYNTSGFGVDVVDSVTWNTPGTYQVCLTISDSVASCGDTLCDSILVTGGSNLSGSAYTTTNATCGNCNGQAAANGFGGVTPYSYLWSTGATTQAITGLCAGNYSVTILDANFDTVSYSTSVLAFGGNSVSLGPDITTCVGDTVLLDAGNTLYTSYVWNTGDSSSTINVTTSGSYSVTVTDSNGCAGSDTIQVTFTNGPALSMSSTNETCSACCDGTASVSGSGPYDYTWSNGAGNVSSQTGLCPGTYTVTVEDTLSGCASVSSVTITAYTSSCYTLAGEITQGALVQVYLIQEANAALTAVDSTMTDSTGLFVFYGVCNGTYYVKGALLPAHAAYATTIPTYYDSAALWGQATSFVVNNAAIYGVDFTLLSGTNNGGAGFIGGLISQGANRDENDPVVGAHVVAYNEDGSMAAFAVSDANGEYSIDNLSIGIYDVYVEVLNKTPYPHTVTLTAETSTSDNRDFEVVGDIIKPIEPVGVNELSSLGLKVYPNPTNGLVNISGLTVESVTVYNSIGQQVESTLTITSDVVNVDLTNMPSGMYILEIRTNEGIGHQTVLVK